MGPGVTGRAKDLVGKPSTLDDGRPGGFYLTRFRNLSEKHPKFSRGYGFEGGSGCGMFPQGTEVHGFGASFKEEVRKNQGAYISMGAFGEVLARYENYVDIDPVVRDKWGIPALRFHYKFGDNEHRMAEDMKETSQEMFEAAGFEIVRVSSRVLTEGWSIHELGTARMGTDPKTSVLNQFQQSHDVKNLFVVDGSGFVSASRSEEHTSELQSRLHLVCRLLLGKKNKARASLNVAIGIAYAYSELAATQWSVARRDKRVRAIHQTSQSCVHDDSVRVAPVAFPF